jgi:hypothetical protein
MGQKWRDKIGGVKFHLIKWCRFQGINSIFLSEHWPLSTKDCKLVAKVIKKNWHIMKPKNHEWKDNILVWHQDS